MRRAYTNEGKRRYAFTVWTRPDGRIGFEPCPHDDQMVENPHWWVTHEIIVGKSAVVYIVTYSEELTREQCKVIAGQIMTGKVKLRWIRME